MISDFTSAFNNYTDKVHLPSEMATFGTYRLQYEPPEGGIETQIDMSISSEASVDQMLEFFKSFLMAAGYFVNPNENLVIEKESDPFSMYDPYSTSPPWINFTLTEDTIGPFKIDESNGNQ